MALRMGIKAIRVDNLSDYHEWSWVCNWQLQISAHSSDTAPLVGVIPRDDLIQRL
jgi:hypothetical protein